MKIPLCRCNHSFKWHIEDLGCTKIVDLKDYRGECKCLEYTTRWKVISKFAYIVSSTDADDGCVAVVAESPNQAKKYSGIDVDYIELRVKSRKDVDVSKLPFGEIQDVNWALEKGLYGFLINTDCPKCGGRDITLWYDNGFYCSQCEDKEATK